MVMVKEKGTVSVEGVSLWRGRCVTVVRGVGLCAALPPVLCGDAIAAVSCMLSLSAFELRRTCG